MSRLRSVAVAGLLVGCLVPVAATAASPSAPPTLRETGLYDDGPGWVIAPGNLAYSPQYPLWTDGADKSRWIHLPEGTAVDASRPDDWQFPAGTKLWKEFAFDRRVETRYMERLEDGGWIFATYVWDEDESQATLTPTQGLRGVVPTGTGTKHDIPGFYECLSCHLNRPNSVLGFTALQLSPDRDPLAPHGSTGPGDYDLRRLLDAGLIANVPDSLRHVVPVVAADSPRERAVLGYFYGNCGGCHNDVGRLAYLGLSFDVPWRSVATSAALATTVGWQAKVGGPRSKIRLVPGDPAASVLWERMETRNQTLQMPPLGTHLADAVAVRLVEAWIRDLPPAAQAP